MKKHAIFLLVPIAILVLIGSPAYATATLSSISFDQQRAKNETEYPGHPGDITEYFSDLTVRFWIHNHGPAHTAHLKYTTTDWATDGIVKAKFISHSGGRELWEAFLRIHGHSATFEYVIIAEDHLGNNEITTRYYNNNGNGCRIQATNGGTWTNNPRP